MRIRNRKAQHNFHIKEVVEAGLSLQGTEVKSLRDGQARIDESYARVKGGELFLVGANIAIYPNAKGELQHAPTRDRKLLLHRRQISQIEAHVRQKGKTVVPLALYFKNGWAKCQLGIAEGKRQYDKRDAIRERDRKRDLARQMARRR
jgi:SsrA-binding protein